MTTPLTSKVVARAKDLVRPFVPAKVRQMLRRRQSTPTRWDAWAMTPRAEREVEWLAHDAIRLYVNECVTGIPWMWPLVAFKAGWAYKPLERGLSIGCGTGGLERAIWDLRICRRIDATDVSREMIRVARQLARREKMDGIRYRVDDADRCELPENQYDIVFFHASLHHIADPDRILQQVEKTLKPHGLLYIDDYIGPSRNQWTEDHLRHARAEYDELDPALRSLPLNAPFDHTDPSEMVRSDRVWPAVQERFAVLHFRPYWGNLLMPLLSHLHGSELQKPERQPLLHQLIERERELVRSGEFVDPMYAVILAGKRPHWSR